jgi:hypothetical protein
MKERLPWYHFIKNKTLYKLFSLISLFLIEYNPRSSKLKSKKSRIFNIALDLASFVLITLIFFGVFFLATKFSILNDLRFNFEIMQVIMLVLVAVLLISTIVKLVKNLYYRTDSQILFPLPIGGNVIFTAKLLSTLMLEMMRSLRVMIPAFLAYGLICHFIFPYYLIVIFGSIIIIMAISFIASILSIPALYVARFFTKHYYLLILFFGILLGLLIFVLFKLIASLPDDMNILNNFFVYYMALQNMLKTITLHSPITGLLTHFLIGQMRVTSHIIFTTKSLYTLLVLLGIIVSLGVTTWYGSRHFYLYVSKQQLEFDKSNRKTNKKVVVRRPYLSILNKEIKEKIRSPRKLFSDTAYVFVMPFVILLLNKTLGNIDMSVLGKQLSVVATLLMVLTLILSSNTFASSIISSEGSSFPILQSTPQDMRKIIIMKAIPNIVLSIISLVATTFLLSIFDTFSSGQLVMIFFSVLMIYFGHLFSSIDLDLLKPKFDLYLGGEAIVGDSKLTKSFLFGLVIALLFSSAIFLFLREDYTNHSNLAYLKILGLALAFVSARIALNVLRLKTYFYLMGDET